VQTPEDDILYVIDAIDGTTAYSVSLGHPETYRDMAYNPANHSLYMSNGNDGPADGDTVTVFDADSRTVTHTIAVATIPTQPTVDAARNLIYVPSSSGSVSIINGATNTVLLTVATSGSRPEDIEVDPATGNAYVSGTNGNTLVTWRIDGGTHVINPIFSVSNSSFYGSDADFIHDNLYVAGYAAGAEIIYTIDTTTDTWSAYTLPTNSGIRNLIYDADRNLIYLPLNRQIAVFDPIQHTFTLVATLPSILYSGSFSPREESDNTYRSRGLYVRATNRMYMIYADPENNSFLLAYDPDTWNVVFSVPLAGYSYDVIFGDTCVE
jgi:DNA-binding beta-propeller fold protein YncE